jgi:hypothetical protein
MAEGARLGLLTGVFHHEKIHCIALRLQYRLPIRTDFST